MADTNSFYNQISEDYPTGWDKKEFDAIDTFTEKLRYAQKYLRKIASGSGRVVFAIDDSKALKIAKNKKGLAQNRVESEYYLQNYEVVARTFSSGDDVKNIGPFYVEMELARRLVPKRFKEISGVSFNELAAYLLWDDDVFHGRDKWRNFGPEQLEIKSRLDDNEFVVNLVSLMRDYDMPAGDLRRLSSYGEVIRNGKPAIVLVDFGLTEAVYRDYYKVGMY